MVTELSSVFEGLDVVVPKNIAEDKCVDEIAADVALAEKDISGKLSFVAHSINDAIEKYKAIKLNLVNQKTKLILSIQEVDTKLKSTNREITKLQQTLALLMDQENNIEKPVRRRKSTEAVTARILRSFVDSSDSSVSKVLSLKEICNFEEDYKLTPMQVRYWMHQHEEENYIVKAERPEDSENAGSRTYFFKLTEAGLALAHKS